MDRRRAAGALLALAACFVCSAAAPTASDHTALDLYDGTTEGCYYNFQHYGEGGRIMTNEPCLNCTCHNRMLMCYLRVCPFTKAIGQDCTVEKRADQCCPIVTCPDVPVDLLTSTSTTSPAEYGGTGLGKVDNYGCSINGKYFPEGAKVPPTPNKPCEHCYCIRNMTTCVMQECTLHVDGCTPIYHKDVCCPVRYFCDHPEDKIPLLDDMTTTVRPTPGFLLTTTTEAPVTEIQIRKECTENGQLYHDGALIKTEKPCVHCYCMKGDIVCVVQECGTPMENEGKNCTSLPPREGQCCPDTYICDGDELPTEIATETPFEDLTTLQPPRRIIEGSGYRNEPDEIPYTEIPTSVSEIEGSGEEEPTMKPVDTSDLFISEKHTTVGVSEDKLTPTEQGLAESVVTTQPQTTEPDREQNTVPTDILEKESSEPTLLEQTKLPVVTETTIIRDQETVTEEETSESTTLEKTTPKELGMTSVSLETETASEPSTSETAIPKEGVKVTEQALEKEPASEPSVHGITDQSITDHEVITEEFIFGPSTTHKTTSGEPSATEQNIIEEITSEPPIYEKSTSKEQLEISDTMPVKEPTTDSIEIVDRKDETTELPVFDRTSSSHETTESAVTSGDEQVYGGVTEKESSEPSVIQDTALPSEAKVTVPTTISEESSESEHESTAFSVVDQTTSKYEPTIPIKHETVSVGLPESDLHDTMKTSPREDVDSTEPTVPDEQNITPSEDEKEESSEATFIEKTTPRAEKETKKPTFGEETTISVGLEEEITSEPTLQDKTTKYEDEVSVVTETVTSKEHATIPSEIIEKKTTESSMQEKTTVEDEIISTQPAITLEGKRTTLVEDLIAATTEPTFRREDEGKTPPDSSIKEEEKPITLDGDNLGQTTVKHEYDGISSTEASVPTVELESKLTTLPSPEQHIDEEYVPTKASTIESVSDEETMTPRTEISATSLSDKSGLPETTTLNPKDNEIGEDISPTLSPGRIPGEGDCLLNGVTYMNDSLVPNTNKCHSSCKCISSIIKCDPIICSPQPEYMDNCQLVYDTPDSCCPTYVCDHTRETSPPQSHSQMSGTETPLPSPSIECHGDQCEVTEDTSVGDACGVEGCESITQGPTQPQLPPAADECTGDNCAPSIEACTDKNCQLPPTKDSSDIKPIQVTPSCDNEEDCKESKIPDRTKDTCEGNECEISTETPPPKHIPQLCDNDDCKEIPEGATRPCEGENCPSIIDQPCDKEKGCDISTSKPCEGENCDIKPQTEQTVPQVCENQDECKESKIPESSSPPCEGESCMGDKEGCTSGDCSFPSQTTEQGTECTEENGCKKETEYASEECTDEKCKKTDISDLEHKLPPECTGSECVQQQPTSPSEETTITEQLYTESPLKASTESESITSDESVTKQGHTESPASVDQKIITELPEVYSTISDEKSTKAPQETGADKQTYPDEFPESATTEKEQTHTKVPEKVTDMPELVSEENIPEVFEPSTQKADIATEIPEMYVTETKSQEETVSPVKQSVTEAQLHSTEIPPPSDTEIPSIDMTPQEEQTVTSAELSTIEPQIADTYKPEPETITRIPEPDEQQQGHTATDMPEIVTEGERPEKTVKPQEYEISVSSEQPETIESEVTTKISEEEIEIKSTTAAETIIPEISTKLKETTTESESKETATDQPQVSEQSEYTKLQETKTESIEEVEITTQVPKEIMPESHEQHTEASVTTHEEKLIPEPSVIPTTSSQEPFTNAPVKDIDEEKVTSISEPSIGGDIEISTKISIEEEEIATKMPEATENVSTDIPELSVGSSTTERILLEDEHIPESHVTTQPQETSPTVTDAIISKDESKTEIPSLSTMQTEESIMSSPSSSEVPEEEKLQTESPVVPVTKSQADITVALVSEQYEMQTTIPELLPEKTDISGLEKEPMQTEIPVSYSTIPETITTSTPEKDLDETSKTTKVPEHKLEEQYPEFAASTEIPSITEQEKATEALPEKEAVTELPVKEPSEVSVTEQQDIRTESPTDMELEKTTKLPITEEESFTEQQDIRTDSPTDTELEKTTKLPFTQDEYHMTDKIDSDTEIPTAEPKYPYETSSELPVTKQEEPVSQISHLKPTPETKYPDESSSELPATKLEEPVSQIPHQEPTSETKYPDETSSELPVTKLEEPISQICETEEDCKEIKIPEVVEHPCMGESCPEKEGCKNGECITQDKLPTETSHKGDECTEKDGCKKPDDETYNECIGDHCRRKETPVLEHGIKPVIDDKMSTEQPVEEEHTHTELPIDIVPEHTKAPEEIYTEPQQQSTETPSITSENTEQPLSKEPQDIVTKLPEVITEEIPSLPSTVSHKHDITGEEPELTTDQELVTEVPIFTSTLMKEHIPESHTTETQDVTPQEDITKSPETLVTEHKEIRTTVSEMEVITTKKPSALSTEPQDLTTVSRLSTTPEYDTLHTVSQEIELNTEEPSIATEKPERLPATGEAQTETLGLRETTTHISDQKESVTTEQIELATMPSKIHDTEQEQHTDSPDSLITKPQEIASEVTETEQVYPEKPAPGTTESVPVKLPVETESPLVPSSEATTSIVDEKLEQTTEQKKEPSETTPYLVELEEHTHKMDEEASSISSSEEPTTLQSEIPDIEEKPEEIEKLPEEGSQTESVLKETTIPSIEKEPIDESSRPVVYHTTSIPLEETSDITSQSASSEQTTSQPFKPTLDTQETESVQDQEITTSTPALYDEKSPAVAVTDSEKPATAEDETTKHPEKDVTSKPSESSSPFDAVEEEFIPAATKATTAKIEEEITTQPPIIPDKFTKPSEMPYSSTSAPDTPKPVFSDLQPTDEVPSPEDESHFPPSGGYGQEPDYVEEDQAFGPGTCRYGGKVYVSAQQIPRDDPCDFCFCFRSDIICLQQSCPPPIHGCHEEPIQGFCCPRYECPVSMATTVNITTTTTTTTTTLPPNFLPHAYKGAAQRRGCQIKGHTYKVGDVVRASSGPCLHCTCGGDGQMKCDPKVCTPEPMLRQMIAAAVSAERRR